MSDISRIGLEDRLGVVLRKASKLLPGDVGHHLQALVSPESLAIMASVVVVWAASHFVGVGEISDVALLIGGWLTIGAGAASGCRKLLSFALGTHSARTEADLDRAARDLADAIAILGVDVALGLLFKGRPKNTFAHSYKGVLPPMARAVAAMPRGGPRHPYEFQIIYTRSKFAGEGGTTVRNIAKIGRDPGGRSVAEAARDMRKAAHHEVVHLWLNRAFSAFGRPALYLKTGAYKRSYLLRYLEEAVAEGRAQRIMGRQNGEIVAYKFPFDPKYHVTIQQMGTEASGILLGPVVVGGAIWQAYYGFDHADR